MRLLNVKSFKLEEFQDDVPKYAIGSHRWSFDEALFSDVRLARNTEGDGYKKLVAFADYMKQNLPAVEWLWIDTCCINHQDPTEVTQNLDFMFKWFRNAEVCLAYLADVEVATDMDQFRQSVWFTRCWTLQDLLAPRIVVFLSASWEVIGNKGMTSQAHWLSRPTASFGTGLEKEIVELTSVPEQVLHNYETSYDLSVDVKMSWMNGRASTREEDTWYALCGILDAVIGTRYGEGHARAKRRLLDAVNWRRGPNIIYSDLDVARSQIRLLEILRAGEEDSTITCSLFPVSIQNPTKYVALSYTWGDSRATIPITILHSQTESQPGISLPITYTLEAALRELYRQGIRYVWADMICINQKDFQERSNQVSLMSQIYAKATKVVAWLGAPDDASRMVMAAIASSEPQGTITGNDDGFPTSKVVGAFQAFLSRPYFSRIWIIQEVAKAKSVELWCGHDSVDFEDFLSFLALQNIMAVIKDPDNQAAHLKTVQSFRERELRSRRGLPRMLLSQALVESWSSKSTDPRDKMYALLGLTVDGGDIIDYPSYTKSVGEVFRSAMTSMIAEQGHTALILLARGSSGSQYASSWMIDPNRRPPLPPWVLESLRRKRDSYDYAVSISQERLFILGCYLDTVEDITQDSFEKRENEQSAEQKSQRLTMRDWAAKFESEPSLGPVHELLTNSTRGTSESDKIEAQLIALERGVRIAAKYSMRLMNLRHRGFRMVHQDAQHGDQIFRLENCPLPVVLRPLSNHHYRLVGEVYVDVREDEWWKTVWEDFHMDEPDSHFMTISID